MANIGSMDDIQNLFKETIAEFMENGLEAELDDELGYSKYDYKNKDTDNSRNGHSSKTLRTSFGDVDVSVPRDRKGEFEPQVLKKNQTGISQDIEEKILSMYAKGMTTSDIETHIQDIYGISVSDSTVSRITDKILPIAKEWQQRPLEPIYAMVFLDAIHYHVRSEGQIVKKAVYIAIGVNLDGRKDVLGMWVGENDSAKFWTTVLNGLKNRGIEDIFIACTDNLTGFDAAIHAVFPQTEIQNCIIHQLRNSSKYVSYKDLKALMADLKAVYAAVYEQAALDALDTFGERWDKKHPKISQSWRDVIDTVIVNHSDTEIVYHQHHIPCRIEVTLGARRERYGSGDVTLLTDPGSLYFRRIPAVNCEALGRIKTNCQKVLPGSYNARRPKGISSCSERGHCRS